MKLLLALLLLGCTQTQMPKLQLSVGGACEISYELLNYQNVRCDESPNSPRLCFYVDNRIDEDTGKVYYMLLWLQRTEICEDGWEILSLYKWYPEGHKPEMLFDREEVYKR